MSDVFIIQNHDRTYLTKHGEWADGTETSQLFRSSHKDEAINTKVEQSVRNPRLRLRIINAELTDKGSLRLSDTPPEPNIDSAAEVLFNIPKQQPEDSEPAPIDGAGEHTA